MYRVPGRGQVRLPRPLRRGPVHGRLGGGGLHAQRDQQQQPRPRQQQQQQQQQQLPRAARDTRHRRRGQGRGRGRGAGLGAGLRGRGVPRAGLQRRVLPRVPHPRQRRQIRGHRGEFIIRINAGQREK